MPDISDAEFRQFVRYQGIGTPEEITKKIGDLEKDNHDYRQVEKPALEAKQLKDGEVAVPKAKADLLPAYEALGTPEDLKTGMTERETLRTKDTQRTREDAFRGATRAIGWPEDTVATLLDMRSLEGAQIELKDETADGKTVKVPYVTLAGDGQKAQKLTEFAANTPQLKGLKTESGTNNNSRSSSREYFSQREESREGDDKGGNLIDQQLEANKKAATAPNPLRPAAAKT